MMGEFILENNAYLYTGQPICPNFTLNIGGKELHSGTDYDVEITDNINVGTAHVLIKGKGKFKGVIERFFEIKPVPAKSLSFFADRTEFDYTGEPCTVKVIVRFGETVLTENEDYTLEYENNIEPGTGNVILRFMGNYEGIMTIPFAIFPPHQEEEEVSEPSVPVLENLSVLSADKIRLGETVQVRAAAQGGTSPYTYSVFLCKIKKQNWKTIQENSEETLINITPASATRYLILVKVKDSSGKLAKQYFKLNVNLPEEEADSPSS